MLYRSKYSTYSMEVDFAFTFIWQTEITNTWFTRQVHEGSVNKIVMPSVCESVKYKSPVVWKVAMSLLSCSPEWLSSCLVFLLWIFVFHCNQSLKWQWVTSFTSTYTVYSYVLDELFNLYHGQDKIDERKQFKPPYYGAACQPFTL